MEIDYYRSRRTIEKPLKFDGVGIHTGHEVDLEIQPAEAGHGIQFIRSDEKNSEPISMSPDSIFRSQRNTTIGTEKTNISTVEHLLGALYGLGITDVLISVNGPEIPALDGSAQPFVEKIDETGLDELNQKRPVHHVEETTSVTLNDSSIVVAPSTSPEVQYTLSYEDRTVDDQFYSLVLSPDNFRDKIAPARTYGFKDEVEALLEDDLAQGGSLDNAVVIDEDGDFLGDGPRLEKELVRHKILDLLGDLALSGHFIVGRIIGVKGSHEINAGLIQEMDIDVGSEEKKSDKSEQSGVPASTPLNIEDIREVLPHRYPFLLIDRIVSINYEEATAIGFKNVTINEEYFQGHFPDDPVMPGVLVIEAMAQLGAACILRKPKYDGKNSYFMGLDDVKWRKPVRPGDRVYFEIEGQRMRSRYGLVEGKAIVDGELAAEGLYKFAIVDQ